LGALPPFPGPCPTSPASRALIPARLSFGTLCQVVGVDERGTFPEAGPLFICVGLSSHPAWVRQQTRTFPNPHPPTSAAEGLYPLFLSSHLTLKSPATQFSDRPFPIVVQVLMGHFWGCKPPLPSFLLSCPPFLPDVSLQPLTGSRCPFLPPLFFFSLPGFPLPPHAGDPEGLGAFPTLDNHVLSFLFPLFSPNSGGAVCAGPGFSSGESALLPIR